VQIVERVLVRLDLPPWEWLFRVFAGYLIFPAWVRLADDRRSEWTLILFLPIVLVALKLVPLLSRRLLHVGESVEAVWAERRQLARRFDSYQWRKLFWIGLGMALFALHSRERSEVFLLLMSSCLLSGVVGIGIWHNKGS
jgi:hypothetical protein